MLLMQSADGELDAALKTAQRGDVRGFNVVVELYQRQLYNVCFRTV